MTELANGLICGQTLEQRTSRRASRITPTCFPEQLGLYTYLRRSSFGGVRNSGSDMLNSTLMRCLVGSKELRR